MQFEICEYSWVGRFKKYIYIKQILARCLEKVISDTDSLLPNILCLNVSQYPHLPFSFSFLTSSLFSTLWFTFSDHQVLQIKECCISVLFPCSVSDSIGNWCTNLVTEKSTESLSIQLFSLSPPPRSHVLGVLVWMFCSSYAVNGVIDWKDRTNFNYFLGSMIFTDS